LKKNVLSTDGNHRSKAASGFEPRCKHAAHALMYSQLTGCATASAALLVDFDLHLDFNVNIDLGLHLNDGRPQWVVDANFLSNNFERDGERVACSCVRVTAPTLVSAHRDTEVIGQSV
jgi:hypothetical protein